MKLKITVKKYLSPLGEKRVKVDVSSDSLTSEVFDNMRGSLLALRKIENGTFVEGAGFNSYTTFAVTDDVEIGEKIAEIVGLYKQVLKGKKEWDEIVQKEFEI
jgi:hypothetical protein